MRKRVSWGKIRAEYSEPGNDDNIQMVRQFYRDRLSLEKHWEGLDYVYGWRNPIGYYVRQRVRHCLIKMLNKHSLLLADKNILDIGCGYGDWLRFFAEIRGTSRGLAGIDISSERIAKAKVINPGIEYTIGDALCLPFPEESFNMVTQFDTFEHFINKEILQKSANEITRVLKSNGFLLWFDLLPRHTSDSINRGYSLEEVKALFPKFDLIDFKPIFKKLNLGFTTVSTAYELPRFSLILTDLIEKIPLGKHNNLMVLMRKNA